MKIAALAFALIALQQAPAPEAAAPAGKPPGDGLELEQQLDADATVNADPGRSYIFFRTKRRMGVLFQRALSAVEREAEAAQAMVLAQERYQEMLAEYRRVNEACLADSSPVRCRRTRWAPVAPTPESALDELEPDRHLEIVYRNPVFSQEANGDYTYLLPVHPGTYILYGQRDGVGGGWVGVCLCMGSLRFDVAAGEVADLGTITYPALDAAAAREATDSAFMDGGRPSMAVVLPGPDTIVPARLSGLRIVPARLRAADKMPNLFGLYIDRHPALAGVLNYERDRVIDLAPAPAP